MEPTLPTKATLLNMLQNKKMASARRYVNKESERISLIKDRAMFSTSAFSGERCYFLQNLDEREIVHILKEEYDACVAYNRASAKKAGIISGAVIGMAVGFTTGIVVGIVIPPVGAAIIGGTIAGTVSAGGTGTVTGLGIYIGVRQEYVQRKIIQQDDDRYIRIRLKIKEIELKITDFKNNNLNQDADQLKIAKVHFQSVADVYLLSRKTLHVVHS